MNKKGALFHWILLGILVSLGIFFVFFSSGNTFVPVKGVWHASFLQDVYLEAEKEVFVLSLDVKQAGEQFLREQAAAGYASACGQETSFPLWNVQETWCPLDGREELERSLQQTFPHLTLTADDSFISAHGNPVKKQGDTDFYATYEYSPSFTVQMRQDVHELSKIQGEALALLEQCRLRKDVDVCIPELHPDWSCPADFRKVLYDAYRLCAETEDASCVCPIQLPEGDASFQFSQNQQDSGDTILNIGDTYHVNLGRLFHPLPSSFTLDDAEATVLYTNKGGQEEDYALEADDILYLLRQENELNFAREEFLPLRRMRLWNDRTLPGTLPVCSLPPSRVRQFCVQEKALYQFSLDFTPLAPFPVEEVGIEYNAVAQHYELQIKHEATAQSYKVYLTDYLPLASQQGTAEELSRNVRFGSSWEVYDVVPLPSCPAEKKTHEAYMCGENIVYTLADLGKEFLVAVTQLSNGKESQITQFQRIGLSS